MAVLEGIDISKRFGGCLALDKVSIDVEKGKVTSIIGPSGSGKSTFLRCVCCLERIDGGTIMVDGEKMAWEDEKGARYLEKGELRRVRGKLSMVFQSFNLFPHLSVTENLTIAQRAVLGRSKSQAAEKAAGLLEKVGLWAKRDNYPCELSGGQQQRVAIARALAMDPFILCFDEPTSALDPELTGEVLKVIRNLARDGSITMLIVTHEMGFAGELSDKVVFMDQGKVIDRGTPKEIFTETKEPRIQAFLDKLLTV